MPLLELPSCWYLVVALLWSSYQGLRGVIETRLTNASNKWSQWQKVVVLDVHDFVFRFVCTLAGFVALLISYRIANTICTNGEVSTGLAALLAAAFLIGVVGVGGQLHYLILLGKVPGAKAS